MKSIVKSALVFMLHQFIATIGFFIWARLLVYFSSDLFRLFGWRSSVPVFSWAIAGNPYHPLLIFLALGLGWLLGRRFQHKSALWVWVLPFVFLCYALAAVQTFYPYPHALIGEPQQTRFLHYFGGLCRPPNRCVTQAWDQLYTTLPFYAAAFYSIGALLARTFSKSLHSRGRHIEFAAVLTTGLILLVESVVGFGQLVLYWKQIQSQLPIGLWGRNWFLPLALTVAGGVGASLIHLAFTLRKGPLPGNTDSGPEPQCVAS